MDNSEELDYTVAAVCRVGESSIAATDRTLQDSSDALPVCHSLGYYACLKLERVED